MHIFNYSLQRSAGFLRVLLCFLTKQHTASPYSTRNFMRQKTPEMLCSTNSFACSEAKETQIYSSLFNQFYIPIITSFLNTSRTEICFSLEVLRSSVIHLHHNKTRVTWLSNLGTNSNNNRRGE